MKTINILNSPELKLKPCNKKNSNQQKFDKKVSLNDSPVSECTSHESLPVDVNLKEINDISDIKTNIKISENKINDNQKLTDCKTQFNAVITPVYDNSAVPIPFPGSAKSTSDIELEKMFNHESLAELSILSFQHDSSYIKTLSNQKEIFPINDKESSSSLYSKASELIVDKSRDSNLKMSHLAAASKNLPKIINNISIGLETIPEQRLKRVFKQKNKSIGYTYKTSSNNIFNLMVVGQQGMGKSTFVNSLFHTQILHSTNDNQKNVNLVSLDSILFDSSADVLAFESKKTTKIQKTYVMIEEEKVNLKLCIIDTPGFGGYSNNSFSWVPICEYIDSQFTQFMFNEEQPYRDMQVDSRVHCCLYFLPPTNKGISPLNILSMQEISKRVNLIPVISKSDGLTSDEKKNFKSQIRAIVEKQNIKICDLLFKDQFESNSFVDFPYAIIGGQYNTEFNKLGRKYKHGFVDIMNETYSDFAKLRKFIIQENMLDLIHSTNMYYEIWRNKLLKFRFDKMTDLLNNFNEKKQDSKPSESDKLLFPKINETDLEKIGCSTKKVSELSLKENVDSNGLDNYKVYKVINKTCLDRHLLEWDPKFIQKQWVLKNSFNEIVCEKEQEFKNWKKTLFDKQSKFNEEIDTLYTQLKQMVKECHLLEQQIKSKQAKAEVQKKKKT
ncbi:hypothetical protein QEN19_004204 [Hanseniaspora menglaensis]